tara:strand:+ start:429 stop:554 length:126 start_codon:yes stop_codon:yes gene_type:complete
LFCGKIKYIKNIKGSVMDIYRVFALVLGILIILYAVYMAIG